jgi:hypothetical protein
VLEVILRFGVTGALGLLLGLAAVWWIEPTTDGGVALLLFVFALLAVVIGAAIMALRAQNRGYEKRRRVRSRPVAQHQGQTTTEKESKVPE